MGAGLSGVERSRASLTLRVHGDLEVTHSGLRSYSFVAVADFKTLAINDERLRGLAVQTVAIKKSASKHSTSSLARQTPTVSSQKYLGRFALHRP